MEGTKDVDYFGTRKPHIPWLTDKSADEAWEKHFPTYKDLLDDTNLLERLPPNIDRIPEIRLAWVSSIRIHQRRLSDFENTLMEHLPPDMSQDGGTRNIEFGSGQIRDATRRMDELMQRLNVTVIGPGALKATPGCPEVNSDGWQGPQGARGTQESMVRNPGSIPFIPDPGHHALCRPNHLGGGMSTISIPSHDSQRHGQGPAIGFSSGLTPSNRAAFPGPSFPQSSSAETQNSGPQYPWGQEWLVMTTGNVSAFNMQPKSLQGRNFHPQPAGNRPTVPPGLPRPAFGMSTTRQGSTSRGVNFSQFGGQSSSHTTNGSFESLFSGSHPQYMDPRNLVTNPGLPFQSMNTTNTSPRTSRHPRRTLDTASHCPEFLLGHGSTLDAGQSSSQPEDLFGNFEPLYPLYPSQHPLPSPVSAKKSDTITPYSTDHSRPSELPILYLPRFGLLPATDQPPARKPPQSISPFFSVGRPTTDIGCMPRKTDISDVTADLCKHFQWLVAKLERKDDRSSDLSDLSGNSFFILRDVGEAVKCLTGAGMSRNLAQALSRISMLRTLKNLQKMLNKLTLETLKSECLSNMKPLTSTSGDVPTEYRHGEIQDLRVLVLDLRAQWGDLHKVPDAPSTPKEAGLLLAIVSELFGLIEARITKLEEDDAGRSDEASTRPQPAALGSSPETRLSYLKKQLRELDSMKHSLRTISLKA